MGGSVTKEKIFSLPDTISNFGSFHCAMIGLDSAGKTTILYRLKLDHYINSAPTIGFNCEKVILNSSLSNKVMNKLKYDSRFESIELRSSFGMLVDRKSFALYGDLM